MLLDAIQVWYILTQICLVWVELELICRRSDNVILDTSTRSGVYFELLDCTIQIGYILAQVCLVWVELELIGPHSDKIILETWHEGVWFFEKCDGQMALECTFHFQVSVRCAPCSVKSLLRPDRFAGAQAIRLHSTNYLILFTSIETCRFPTLR